MSTLSQFGSGGVKSIQRFTGTGFWQFGSNTNVGTSGRFLDIPITPVVANKTIIVPNKEGFIGGDNNIYPMRYFLINTGLIVRCLSFTNGQDPGYYAFEVVEFR